MEISILEDRGRPTLNSEMWFLACVMPVFIVLLLGLLLPNSHKTCVLGQNIGARNNLEKLKNLSLFWSNTTKKQVLNLKNDTNDFDKI